MGSGDMMLVDGGEEDWLRLHDIRLNGQILEYTGRGKSLIDVGLAQAKNPITTRHHYFEIEIVDPGVSCYIAIGLARRDYPRNRHPGWNKGSIAYLLEVEWEVTLDRDAQKEMSWAAVFYFQRVTNAKVTAMKSLNNKAKLTTLLI